MFYTYLHRRVDTNEVFYIGKGAAERAQRLTSRTLWWNAIVKKAGGRVVEILAQWPTEVDAFNHERFLIASFRAVGAPLCNMTDGGEGACGQILSAEARAKRSAARKGVSPSEACRMAQRAAATGRPLSDAHRAKLSAAGKNPSAETRAKLSAASKNRSPESRAKQAASRAGYTHSNETRAKISAAHKGRSIRPETREKLSAALKGRKCREYGPVSVETRAKMSAAQRAWRQQDRERKDSA